jgi:hypothetical protein
LWCEGQYRLILNVIGRLPRNSHYKSAMALDEELARDAPDPVGVYRPPLTEWSPEREALADVVDSLRVLPAVIAASAGAKGMTVPDPTPRPETAYQRVLAERAKAPARRAIDRIERAHEREKNRQQDEGGSVDAG